MYGLFGRVTRRKASLSENNIAAKFRIAKVQLNTRLLQKPYLHKHLTAAVKHSAGEVMIWACFAATGPVHLAVTESNPKLLCIPKYSRVNRSVGRTCADVLICSG